MGISTSILNLENYKENLFKLENSNTDYIHLDVIDGKFASNKKEYELKSVAKPLDIHFMVEDVKSYVDKYCHLNPVYMTFHIEAGNTLEYIDYIKNKGIKVGIAIKKDTAIEEILPYLDKIDLVLIMAVNIGMGGQSFDKKVIPKIERLISLKDKYHYVIEVDGGINDESSEFVKMVDIMVSGVYIIKDDFYNIRIEQLKNKMKK